MENRFKKMYIVISFKQNPKKFNNLEGILINNYKLALIPHEHKFKKHNKH